MYAIDYRTGAGDAPWTVYRLDVSGFARVPVVAFTRKRDADAWVSRRLANPRTGLH